MRNLAFSMSDGVGVLDGMWKSGYLRLKYISEIGLYMLLIPPWWPDLRILNLNPKKHSFWFEVHASKCKAFASSTIPELGDGMSAANKRKLGKVGNAPAKNAERDMHRLFRREGLCLPIQPSSMDISGENIKYISLSTWNSFLLTEYPHFMLGGFSRDDPTSRILLRTFWENYKANFPDHGIFELHEDGDLGRCVPYYLHIDEGVGLRRSAVLVIAMQCVFGRETAERFRKTQSHVTTHSQQEIDDHMATSQHHNAKGSTYLTRFLYTVLPKKSYSNKKSNVYWGVLDHLAKEIISLMGRGITVEGQRFFPICLGLKGDQPALIKSGAFKRSFMNLGKNKGCCWECLAGFDSYPFEEVGSSPLWCGTVGLVEPWVAGNISPLVQVPSQRSLPHSFWKRDPFHAFKQTLGGHFGASTLIMLAIDFGLWKVEGQSSDVESMLERAHVDFKFYVRHEWRGSVVNHTKSFTRQTLHFPDKMKFPYARWKGSDQMLIIRWLGHLMVHGVAFADSISRTGVSPLHFPLMDWQRPFYQAVLDGCNAAINFFHLLHREGVWLTREVAETMSTNCKAFCRAYSVLARLCHEKRLARYHLEPSLHVFRHFSHDIDVCVGRGCHLILNPATCTCEMDEDFVGKICKLLRHVHAMSTNARTIDRYLLRCHVEFSRGWVVDIYII